MAQWRKRGVLGEVLQAQRSRALRFETLEPRLLLSADLNYFAAAGETLDATLRVDEVDGAPILRLVDNQTSTFLVQQEIDQDIAVSIRGNDQSDTLRIAFDQSFGPHRIDISVTGDGADDTVTISGSLFLSGGNLTIDAESITVESGATISTRDVGAGDPLLDASTGDSGTMRLTGIASGSLPAVPAPAAVHVGLGAKLLANADSGHAPGLISLVAESTQDITLPLGIPAPAIVADASAQVQVSGATLRAGSIVLDARSSFSGRAEGIPFGSPADAAAVIGGSSAWVSVGGSSELAASDTVTLSASSMVETRAESLAVSPVVTRPWTPPSRHRR